MRSVFFGRGASVRAHLARCDLGGDGLGDVDVEGAELRDGTMDDTFG